MSRFLGQHLISFIPTLFGVAVIVFLVMRLIPGDTISAQIGTSALLTEAQTQALRAYYGLDKTIPEQFVSWLGNALQGNLGTSVRSGKPVLGEILNRFPLTAELGILALLIGLSLGIPIGVFTATRRGTLADAAGQMFALFGLAIPNFWLATLLILVFALTWRILPDLLMIDGGKGQLHAAQEALARLSITQPCLISLAKKEEEIYRLDEAEPLKLSRNSAALRLLQYVRDEAHRFAQHYHKLLRHKKLADGYDEIIGDD